MRVRSTVFVMSPDPQDLVYRSIVGAIFISGLYMIAHGIVLSFMPHTLFEPPTSSNGTFLVHPPTLPPHHARLRRHWLDGTPYKVVRRVSVAVMLLDPQDAYRSIVAALLFEGFTVLGDVAADILIRQVLFRLWLLR